MPESKLDQPEPVSTDPKLQEAKSSGHFGIRAWFKRSFNPFRIATLRGLAILLPPLVTILLFVWAWNTIDHSIIRPAESLSQRLIVWRLGDIRDNSEIKKALRNPDESGYSSGKRDGADVVYSPENIAFVQIGNQWIPADVATYVNDHPGEVVPLDAKQYYLRYAESRFLKRHLTIPMVLAIFLAVMYLVGKLLAAGIGRIFWHYIEWLIHRVPIIRNVYSSVKQVTDFAFDDNDVQYNRVVAVEYPRKGIWSIGFVTGESLLDIQRAAGEPMLSVLMPTSPMPATGFTISIPQSEAIDLDISIDQAVQFCVSCGVVVPDHQTAKKTLEGLARIAAEKAKIPVVPINDLTESGVANLKDNTPGI